MVDNEKDKNIIINLFFKEFYKMEQILQYFNNKYYESEIKAVIKEHIKKYT